MVRVDHHSVLSLAQALDALGEVFESQREVARISAGGLEPKTRRSQGARPHQGQDRKPNERHLLRELFERNIREREHRQSMVPWIW